MSSGAFYLAAAAGIGFATVVAFVGVRALRLSRTVKVFEQPTPSTQTYMMQVHPPTQKVQALRLPVRKETGVDLQHEKQA